MWDALEQFDNFYLTTQFQLFQSMLKLGQGFSFSYYRETLLFSIMDGDIVNYRIWDFGSNCERNWYPWENFHSPISTYDDIAEGRTE